MKDRRETIIKVAVGLGLVAFNVTRPEIRRADWATLLSQL